MATARFDHLGVGLLRPLNHFDRLTLKKRPVNRSSNCSACLRVQNPVTFCEPTHENCSKTVFYVYENCIAMKTNSYDILQSQSTKSLWL